MLYPLPDLSLIALISFTSLYRMLLSLQEQDRSPYVDLLHFIFSMSGFDVLKLRIYLLRFYFSRYIFVDEILHRCVKMHVY